MTRKLLIAITGLALAAAVAGWARGQLRTVAVFQVQSPVDTDSGAFKLSFPMREDDWPSAAADRRGNLWVAMVSYSGLQDEIRIRRHGEGRWTGFLRVPEVSGTVWRPHLAIDAQDRLWVVWAQLVNENWDLYAACLEGNRWLLPQRLTSDPMPDFNVDLATDAQGNIHAVWQGWRGKTSQIFLRSFRDGKWQPAMQVSSGTGNNWEPAVAAGSDGTIHVAWDSYRKGNYDIYTRSIAGGKPGIEEALTSSPRFEAHASLAVDRQNRLWVAWEEAPANWGKDTGYTIRAQESGVVLNARRSVEVRVRDGGAWKQPAAGMASALPEGDRAELYAPKLVADGEGALWMHFRHRVGPRQAGEQRPGQPFNQAQNQAQRGSGSYWQNYVARLEGDRWSPARALPNSRDRITAIADAALASDGKLWLVYPTDGRTPPNYHEPRKNDVWAYAVTPSGVAAAPVLKDLELTSAAAPRGHENEPADVAAMRAHRVTLDGTEHRIVRGDFHRHTELSWDGGGVRDGSVLDFYRYMIDAASMDYGAVTDHNAGNDNEYSWWYTQKLTDLFYTPGAFTPIYGYERSLPFPNGHRNVFHARRNTRVVPIFRLVAGPAGVLENDTKLLYESLRRTGGIAISHTSATNMGTDWRDNDPKLEPVVEIFQGCRTNYEAPGAPRSPQAMSPESYRDEAPGGFREEGFVNLAWNKGYRLGITASSDHNSTHISYTMAFVTASTREGILNGYRKRHTYGATDNIILEFWADGHFMGDEYTATGDPMFTIKAKGTQPVAQVDLIKDNKVIFSATPKTRDVAVAYKDSSSGKGTSFYYARLVQTDGQIAWASPVWVKR